MATTFGGVVQLAPSGPFNSSTTKEMQLGQLATTLDGRRFRYFYNGGVATIPGKMYQGPAQDATNYAPAGGLAVGAAAIGTFQVTLTGSLTITLNALAGAFMSVAVTPGQGYIYKVASNTAVAGATGCVVTLEDPLQIALTTSSKVVFVQNPYNACVVGATTLTSSPVGVPGTIHAINNYGWLQVGGMASCLVTGTLGSAGLAVGMLVGGTAGSLAPCIAGTNVLGFTASIAATTEYDIVNLNMN